MSLVLLFSSQEERELKLDNWLKTYFYLNFLVTLYLARVYVSFSSVEKTIMKVLSVDRTSTGSNQFIACQPSLLAARR